MLIGSVHITRAQSGDPVLGRLGGSEDDFSAKYGESTARADVPGRDDASVLSYDVFGFAEVSALIYDGDVVGLTLRPIAGDTWTELAALTVVGDFGPDDGKYDEDRIALGPSDAGNQIGIQGSSDGVEDAADEDVYKEFDLEGDPGDFYVTLYEAAPSFYSGLSINLGLAEESGSGPSAAVGDSAPESQGGFTPEEHAYFDSAIPILDTMGPSLSRFAEEMQEPRIGVDEWTFAVVAELVIWQFEYQEALAIIPPPSFEGLHNLLLDGLSKYSEAADLIIYGLDNFDIGSLEAATTLMLNGGASIQEANALLDVITEQRGL